MLKVRNLTKSYAGSESYAVNNLSLDLRSGEIYGFLGPNGAGKTTTIKMITGILSYSVGEIVVCGHNLKTDSIQAKKSIGFVSDSHVVYDKLTGREYVNFMADIYDVSEEDREERANRLLSLFRLTDAFDKQICTYSHGMKQKISIIGALIHNPSIWILDEPMTGLDPESSHQLKTLMREHCDNGNVVFFSTHVLEVAEKVCDRIGIIVGGELIKEGTVEEIKSSSSDKTLEDVFLSLTDKED